MPLPFSGGLLGDATFEMTSWQDGFDAGSNAQDAREVRAIVRAGEPLPITLAPGGGFVAHFHARD